MSNVYGKWYLIGSCYQGGPRLDRKPISLSNFQQFSVKFGKKNIMIFPILFVIILSDGVFGVSNNPSNVTTPTIQGNMCEVCSCKDGKIDCMSKGLEGHFDDDHWPKGSFVEVSFANNSIVHLKAFPEVVVNVLRLCHNRITTIDESAFHNLRNLTYIDLSHNQLTTPNLGPHIFEGRFSPVDYLPLAKLIDLNLDDNALHSLHQDLFEHLGNLKILTLVGNPFHVIDTSTVLAISSLSELEELDLSYCDLADLPEHIFHTPKNLNRVNLTGNRFTSPPLALEDGKAIEMVSLSENPMKYLDDNAFPIMQKLKKLYLCNMPNLTRISAYAMAGLTNLETLRIEGCPKLEDLDENALVAPGKVTIEWPPLKNLYLGDNALHYLPAGLVGRWDKLAVLDIHNNQWSCDCNNQYLVESLLPGLGKKLMGDAVDTLTCSEPPEHKGKNLTSLSKRHLRCLDLNDARPEKDAAVLVGVLIGVLLAVPATLLIFVFWRRGFFFCGPQGPGTFSRAFYKRADRDDDF